MAVIKPQAIAERLNSLAHEKIDAYRQASMRAARSLSWQSKAAAMLEAYGFAAPVQRENEFRPV